MNKELLDKMNVARHLLPEPGPEVIGELIQEVQKLRKALSEAIRIARGQVPEIDIQYLDMLEQLLGEPEP